MAWIWENCGIFTPSIILLSETVNVQTLSLTTLVGNNTILSLQSFPRFARIPSNFGLMLVNLSLKDKSFPLVAINPPSEMHLWTETFYFKLMFPCTVILKWQPELKQLFQNKHWHFKIKYFWLVSKCCFGKLKYFLKMYIFPWKGILYVSKCRKTLL